MTHPLPLTNEESEARPDSRVFCFVCDKETNEFNKAFTMMVGHLHKRQMSIYINENNTLHFCHGTTWVRSDREEDTGQQMLTVSAEWTIPQQAIVDNDLSLIESGLQVSVESLSAQMASNIYNTVGAAAERVGNVISAEEFGSTAQSFLEMLKRIEFGVDREGKVSLPDLHVGPDIARKLIDELNSQPPEFTEEVERVKLERSELALKKEMERKAKFKVTK